MQRGNDANCCPDITCGCRMEVFSTTKECPNCGGRLRLMGRSQLLQFRQTCPSCGYQSPLVSQQELQVLL